ncbi:MAG TPA: hypothetical protein PKA06_08270, partial [Gemmatales bacterium]|nr:hypothetical protein [Gemmatales bacterium]
QCQQNLGRLSITHSLLDWLVRIETNQLRLSVPEEVKLSEITEKVRNQFAIWLKERGIKLEVADEGSWMLCDETCVEVLLSSALTHAVAACKGDSIHLTLGRSKVRSEDKVELRYEFEAEAPSEEFLADLAQPYRRQNTSFLDHQQKGSVLGLYVAQQLARLLDGEAHLEVADKNQCTLVVRVPTRPPVALQEDSSQEQEVLATVGQFGLGSETVADELVESEEAYSEVHEEELVESAALSRASTIDINTDDAEFVSDTLGDWKLG